jgi:uroporphyrin-III C-methyltransferase
LLTRKAEKLILAADIVFYDALVGPGVLDLIPERVIRVNVGKRSGRHSKDQSSINDALVEAALRGQRVVRLKGGDPSIFGRSTEEMAALAAHDIPVSICPGITAAIAAAASARISLTLRGMARKLTFLTAHARPGEELELDWRALADPETTLAIYMGKAVSGDISRKLIAHGLARDTPALVAENSSLPNQRLVRTRLDLLELATASVITDGPAILLIGAAIGAWPNGMSQGVDGLEAARLNVEEKAR